MCVCVCVYVKHCVWKCLGDQYYCSNIAAVAPHVGALIMLSTMLMIRCVCVYACGCSVSHVDSQMCVGAVSAMLVVCVISTQVGHAVFGEYIMQCGGSDLNHQKILVACTCNHCHLCM